MAAISNQGLRLTVSPASDDDVFSAVGETFDAMEAPLTDVLLRRLGGRAYTIGDSWACRLTLGYVDAAGDLAATDITAWKLRLDVIDQTLDTLLFSCTAGVAIAGNPGAWKEMLLEDAVNGVILIRIDSSESLVTRGGMYRYQLVLVDAAKRIQQTYGGGQVEILPERPA
jgi:hypothetical protein